LSEDGVLVPIIAINKHTGKIESAPEIVTRGFLPSEEGAEIIEQARQITVRTIEQATQEEKTDWGVIKEKIRQDLKRFLNKQTSKRPLILPVILEI
jgi:ribonuclease J